MTQRMTTATKQVTALLLAAILFISTQTSTTYAATFKDVPSTHWAYTEITTLANQGILGGYDDGTFQTMPSVTRAQAAKFLALSLKLKPSPSFKPNYKDVPSTHWAYEYISPLVERGIFSNTERFNPNAPITRAQMAKILSEGYKLIVDTNHQITYRDVPKSNSFHAYITTIAELGITTNPNNGLYNPAGYVTRAHFAVFIYRANEFNKAREKGTIVYDSARRMYIDKSKPSPETPVETKPTEAAKTIPLVNKTRALNGKTALKQDDALSRIAQAKAEDMANHNYFAHTSPTYGTVAQMLSKFNYSWTAYGENIAMGYDTPESVVDAWIESPGHKENILSSNFTNIGVGYATDKTGTPYWVHEFSRK